MPEQDPLVLNYSHLAQFPRAPEALQTLKKIASLVKPIMRARGWRVRELAEFFPDQHNLLGLNVNRGQKILLRLRHPGDRSQFLPREQVIDTMLHELSHNVHGPHDARFHALWNQLRDEHEGLVMKGYTGEGFLSEGRRLGGNGRLPMQEARRLARAQAEKRRAQAAGSGRRLGGAAPQPGQDIRRTIANAADRRNTTLQGCGNEGTDEGEIRAIEEAARRNGFRTRAEEDAANEAAIAQALWELVQEEEKQRYGNYYVPPSAQHPEGSGGGAVMPTQGMDGQQSPLTAPPLLTKSPPVRDGQTRIPAATVAPAPGRTSLSAVSTASSPSSSSSLQAAPSPPQPQRGWTCGTCTLYNQAMFLCCEVCGTERGEGAMRGAWTPNENKRSNASRANPVSQAAATSTASSSAAPPTIDLTGSSPPKKKPKSESKPRPKPASTSSGPTYQPVPTQPNFWQCSMCGQYMERQWWTCSTCGLMKDSSR